MKRLHSHSPHSRKRREPVLAPLTPDGKVGRSYSANHRGDFLLTDLINPQANTTNAISVVNAHIPLFSPAGCTAATIYPPANYIYYIYTLNLGMAVAVFV